MICVLGNVFQKCLFLNDILSDEVCDKAALNLRSLISTEVKINENIYKGSVMTLS